MTALDVCSETFSTFSGKSLHRHTSLVVVTMSTAILSWGVWLPRSFTMGRSSAVNAAFGIATLAIGVPTGVKLCDWILTMRGGRVRVTVPMICALGFLSLFVIGGLTGIILTNPSVDYQVHNSLFLVAHIHNTLIPATLFGMLAGPNFQVPKTFGFQLDARRGTVSALCCVVGFMLAFFPLYALGPMGMPRRTLAFFEPAWLRWTLAVLLGALVILAALATLVVQIRVSIRDRADLTVPAGDPWDGRSLEWATSAPPPEWTFAVLPAVAERDSFMRSKEGGTAQTAPEHLRGHRDAAEQRAGDCRGGGGDGPGLRADLMDLVAVAIA